MSAHASQCMPWPEKVAALLEAHGTERLVDVTLVDAQALRVLERHSGNRWSDKCGEILTSFGDKLTSTGAANPACVGRGSKAARNSP